MQFTKMLSNWLTTCKRITVAGNKSKEKGKIIESQNKNHSVDF